MSSIVSVVFICLILIGAAFLISSTELHMYIRTFVTVNVLPLTLLLIVVGTGGLAIWLTILDGRKEMKKRECSSHPGWEDDEGSCPMRRIHTSRIFIIVFTVLAILIIIGAHARF